MTPQRFDAATILMLDFVGFADMAVSRDPSALISELNDIFSAFDRIVELFGCERMKTIGDAYMAVAGLPEASTDHAQTSPGWPSGCAATSSGGTPPTPRSGSAGSASTRGRWSARSWASRSTCTTSSAPA